VILWRSGASLRSIGIAYLPLIFAVVAPVAYFLGLDGIIAMFGVWLLLIGVVHCLAARGVIVLFPARKAGKEPSSPPESD
jgi:hypothetical protein